MRIVVCLGVVCMIAGAQPPSAGVPVSVTVTAEPVHTKSKDVAPLKREDVMPHEHKDRLTVTDFAAGNAGLELFLLFDDSASTGLGIQLEDIRHFIENLPGNASVGVGYMRNGSVQMAQPLSADHGLAARSLRLTIGVPGVVGSPYLSLQELVKHWPAAAGGNRREVILLSSGDDPLGGNGPLNPYLDSAIEDAQRAGVIVYGVYVPGSGHAGHSMWRANWGQNNLSKIADETGGEAYMLGFGEPVSIAPYLTEIAERFTHQYRVTFLMKPEGKGSLRNVKFTTEIPNVELVAPAKVFVPAAGGGR